MAQFYLIYNRRNKLDKEGKAYLEYAVNLGKKGRKFISTGIKLKPSEWHREKQKITGKHPENHHLNARLNQVLTRLKQAYNEAIVLESNFTMDDVESIIKGDERSYKFADFAWQIHEADTKNLSNGYLRHQKSAIKLFLKFAGANVALKDITPNVIVNFRYHLQDLGLSINSQYSKHRTVKKMLGIAVQKELIDRNPYAGIATKRGPAKGRNGLDFSEIEKIEQLELNSPSAEVVRDIFLFGCYTGIRYSDIQSLNKENVTEEEKGITLSFVMGKTQKTTAIPVTLYLEKLFKGRPAQILKKYYDPYDYYIFPRITNEYANRQLKLIQELTHIKQTLSTHIARHTFCSRLAEVKPDPYLIKQLAGHSDIRTSMIYIHQSKAALEKKLDNIEWE